MKDFSLCQLPVIPYHYFASGRRIKMFSFTLVVGICSCDFIMLWNDISVRAPSAYMFGSRVHNHSQLFSCLCEEFHFTHRLHVIASCDCQCQPRNAKSPWERQLRHYSGSIAFHKRGGDRGVQLMLLGDLWLITWYNGGLFEHGKGEATGKMVSDLIATTTCN